MVGWECVCQWWTGRGATIDHGGHGSHREGCSCCHVCKLHILPSSQVSPSGEVLASLWDQQGEAVVGVSSVEEHDGRLWLGNLRGSGVSYYDLKPSGVEVERDLA